MRQITDVKTVKELLDKYYRPDRYTGRGEEYAAVLVASHTKDYENDGYTIISHHDCVLGVPVFFGTRQEWMSP